MAWFSKEKKLKTREGKPAGPRPVDGTGVWYQCEACSEVSTRAEFEKAWNVCPRCGQHDALPVRRRIDLVLDPNSFEELDAELTPADPLGFSDSKRYRDRLQAALGRRHPGEADGGEEVASAGGQADYFVVECRPALPH